jgi:hypothetical protein
VRPRILLIANVAQWILGDIARHIIAAYSGDFEFCFVTEQLLRRRPDLTAYLLPRVHVVHALSPTGATLLLNQFNNNRPRLITWIHHVTQWSQQLQAALNASALVSCTG